MVQAMKSISNMDRELVLTYDAQCLSQGICSVECRSYGTDFITMPGNCTEFYMALSLGIKQYKAGAYMKKQPYKPRREVDSVSHEMRRTKHD